MHKSLLALIKGGESQTVEFKTSFQKEVIESVVAFANAKGGYIFNRYRYKKWIGKESIN